MIPREVLHDQLSGEDVTHVSLRGQMLLEIPLLNKGSAFSEEEQGLIDAFPAVGWGVLLL